MRNIVSKFKEVLTTEIVKMRKDRGSGFMYLHKDLELSTLASVFISEYLSKTEDADKILINATLRDLKKRRVLHDGEVTFYKHKIEGGLFYYDVHLRTFDNDVYCRGTSTDFATAFAKAIGEVFERTVLKYPDKEANKIEFTTRKVKDVRDDTNYLDFNSLPKPLPVQLEKFPNYKITEEDEFEFVKVKKLSGENVFVPKQAIFFGDRKNVEKCILQSTTHGAGAGHSFDLAFNSAFFEILHRHFFLKSWYHKLSPNLLNLNSLDQTTSLWEKVQVLQNSGFQVNILDYRSESQIPTFICLIEKFGGFYCGGSSSFDKYYAVERSIDEAMSIYYWEVGKLVTGENGLNQIKIDNIKDNFLDATLDAKVRVQVFANSYFIKKLDKFFLSGKKVGINDFTFDKNNFNLKEYIQGKFGEQVFYYETSKGYLEDYNFTTVKIYIPNSYYFPLSEIYARPILQDGVLPKYTGVNPFP